MRRLSKGEKIFNVFNIILLCIALFVTIYPLYYTFIASISDGSEVVKGKVLFFPIDLTLEAYKLIPTIKNFGTAYLNTIFYAVTGMLAGVLVMSMGAYALSRKYLKGRKLFGLLISFTMWFSAGMIPFYLNLDSMNLVNTRSGLILAFLCTPFYIIILRSYFESLPLELEEAAKVDGMSDFKIYTKIMMPLAKPCLCTVALYCAIDRWNGYFWSMILLKDEKLVPLQVLLKKLITENQAVANIDSGASFNYTRETLVYAIAVVAMIPIVAIYPFVQKYFVEGMTVGAVKG
ncbi:carbohydrate ABC transporter permease [Blautia producta]|uniref:carbohydrate ABC transporter permease n=1 Tax=Blautia producta TaxID=33035 RepID=UPI0031B56F15